MVESVIVIYIKVAQVSVETLIVLWKILTHIPVSLIPTMSDCSAHQIVIDWPLVDKQTPYYTVARFLPRT